MNISAIANEYAGERLLRAVCEQQLVVHDRELAGALIEAGERRVCAADCVLYEMGERSQGVFFILHGEIELSRHGNFLERFAARAQVGTWPILYSDPTYDVTARARVDSVLLRVAAQQFRSVGDRFPVLWENLARTQADRLRRMNAILLPKNPVPRLLIGSASESLPAASRLGDLVGANRDVDIQAELWTRVFPPGEATLESLTSGLDEWDFAAFFLTPDDEVVVHAGRRRAPRDNVIFEAGLCMGRLGRRRTFLLRPRLPRDLKIPSDLHGITDLRYDDDPTEVLPHMLSTVKALGARSRVAIERLD